MRPNPIFLIKGGALGCEGALNRKRTFPVGWPLSGAKMDDDYEPLRPRFPLGVTLISGPVLQTIYTL
jgi:hypothetical protein